MLPCPDHQQCRHICHPYNALPDALHQDAHACQDLAQQQPQQGRKSNSASVRNASRHVADNQCRTPIGRASAADDKAGCLSPALQALGMMALSSWQLAPELGAGPLQAQ